MLIAEAEKALLARRLRDFAGSACGFEEVQRDAFEIRDRWSDRARSPLPPQSDSELPLWAAVWDITSSCRESLVAASWRAHPVLQHIAYLEGSAEVPKGWSARRPRGNFQ